MKKMIYRLLTPIAILGIFLALASCSKTDVSKPAPTLTASQSSLSITADTTQTFTANVSAAAGIKEVTVALSNSSIGTVTITNQADLLNKTVATANIQFSSTFTLGTGNITITVTDNASKIATATVTVDVSAHPPIEITGAVGPTGTKELHLTTATTWGPHLTYHVTANVFVEPTGSLTVMEGTTVIVDGMLSFTVRGNFYSYGTATDSVVFTVPSSQRTKANIFAGLWGGVLSSNTDGTNTFAANEMVGAVYTHRIHGYAWSILAGYRETG